ncbi:MAG: endonuclease MutS2 [Oscillospiraceae bacterium]|nr:endonuclease MutS2 [Oscillospiraceae bacterium]
MKEQTIRSLKTLELPAVLELLAQEASSSAAKDVARALSPSGDRAEVERRLNETSAAAQLMVVKGSPSFSGVKDVRASLQRADMGGVLNTRELIDIARVLSAARSVRSYGTFERKEKTCIDYLFNALQANKFLEDKITGSIVGEDEIADAASSELASIRRLIRAASARVHDALQKIISSPSYAKALQEPIITTRSERYVVPVKAEHKGAVPGLVHDVSGSGATLFIEPMAAVKANNELRELRAKEKTEIERILAELSADCAAHREDISLDFDMLVRLDVIFAKAKLAYKLDCTAPALTDRGVTLRRARHPLISKDTVVPIDVALGADYDTLVITGPNTGGKTVTLKTVGLLAVMAQCGLHIPAADGSSLPVFDEIMADIGDEQSIEQSLSTFSAHMTNIVRILDACGERSLVLFDELGAGTDPTEGAALAISVIERARKLGATIAATTHYTELKIYATTQPGVMNASCEFDVETLRPTYHLLIGIPGKSNAFAIAQRLGLPGDVIADAKTRVGQESATFEATIEKLEQVRQLLERDRETAAQELRQAEQEKKKAAMLRAELSVRLEKADEKARREAERLLADVRRTAEDTFRELDAIRKLERESDSHHEANEARAALRRKLNLAEEQAAAAAKEPEEKKVSSRPVKVGDTVEILSMGVKATVTGISKDRTLSLRAGIMNVTAKEDEVYLLENEKPVKVVTSAGQPARLRQASAASEIDLRGMERIEAVDATQRFLDAAVMAKLEEVRIIHGKGTGALREAVQQELRRNKAVKSFRLGRFGEGESGVTVVTMK